MEWCRSCGGRIRPVHERCPWCGSPRPRARAAAAAATAQEGAEPAAAEEPTFTATAEALEDVPAFAAAAASVPDETPAMDLRPERVGARQGEPASLPRRAAAFAIDLALVAALGGAIRLVSVAAIAAASGLSGRTAAAPALLAEALATSGQWALFVGYFGLLQAGAGQSLGKALLGLRVARLDGGPLDVRHGLVRALGYVLSAAAFGLGFLVALLPPRRALHDYLAGSIVQSARSSR